MASSARLNTSLTVRSTCSLYTAIPLDICLVICEKGVSGVIDPGGIHHVLDRIKVYIHSNRADGGVSNIKRNHKGYHFARVIAGKVSWGVCALIH